MRSRISYTPLIITAVVSGATVVRGHKVQVHDAITTAAAGQSVRLTDFLKAYPGAGGVIPLKGAEYLAYTSSVSMIDGVFTENGGVGYGVPKDPSNQTGDRLLTAYQLLQLGSVMEDSREGGTRRYCNHFYEPASAVTGNALSASGPIIGSIVSQCGPHTDARRWVFDTHENNSRSWANALDYAYKSYSEQSLDKRVESLGEMFYTLGHVVHLVEDMSQPSHVRNDAHPDHGYPSALENWEPTHLADVRTILGTYHVGIPFYPSSPEYLANLAVCVSRNFFSDRTTGSDPPFTDTVTSNLAPFISTYPPDWFIDVSCQASSNCGILNRHGIVNEPFEMAYMSSTWFQDYCNAVSVTSDARKHSKINNNCILEENAEELLPLAAASSAGILDFFFRARLKVEINSIVPCPGDPQCGGDDRDIVEYRITNDSPIPTGSNGPDTHAVTLLDLYGSNDEVSPARPTLRLRAEDQEGGLSDPLARVNWPPKSGIPLAPGETVLLRVRYPDEELGSRCDYRTVLVYDGPIGNERGVVGAFASRACGLFSPVIAATSQIEASIAAQTGQGNLVEIARYPSINDDGVVAFVGTFDAGDGTPRHNLYTAEPTDRGYLLHELVNRGFTLPKAGPDPTQTLGPDVQINNNNRVLARRYTRTNVLVGINTFITAPFTYLETWDALTDQQSFATQRAMGNAGLVAPVAACLNPVWPCLGIPSPINYGSPFTGVFNWPNINNNDQFVANVLRQGANYVTTEPSPNYFVFAPTGGGVFPTWLDDDGNFVVRVGPNLSDGIVIFPYDWDPFPLAAVAVNGNGFLYKGGRPGTSDDGRIVGFYGNLSPDGASVHGTTLGEGIFVSLGSSSNQLVYRIAGLSGNGYLDPGETCPPPAITHPDKTCELDGHPADLGKFTAFFPDERVAVSNSGTIAFLANGEDGQKALYTARISFDSQGAPVCGGSMMVAQDLIAGVGTTLGDLLSSPIQDISIHDALNNRCQPDLAFWVDLGGGESAIIRAKAP